MAQQRNMKDPGDKVRRLSPEQRALLALRLSHGTRQDDSRKHARVPDIHCHLERRYEPFALSDIQQAYLIGRSPDVELGNTSCHSYLEIDSEPWDVKRLELAVQKLIERHEMLRCVFTADGRQQILRDVPAYQVKVMDLREQTPTAASSRLAALRQEMSHKIHPSDRWPLFEFCVSHLEPQRSRLHVSIDLLIADGRSFEILFHELNLLYRDPQAVLPPLELSFRDYLLALHSLEDTEIFLTSREYWRTRLGTLPPAPELPLAANPAALRAPIFKRRHARLDPRVWEILKGKASPVQVTPAGLLLAAYTEVLAIWSKSQQFTVNLTLFNRLPLHRQVNGIIGDFTSVNLLEVDHRKGDFEARARGLQEQLWRDLEHRHFSGLRVMREWTRMQGLGPKALMPVVFTSLLNTGRDQEKSWSERLGQKVYGITQTPQVYLDCMVHEESGALVIEWDTVDDLFPPGFLDDLFHGYVSLLEQLASDDSIWHCTLAEVSEKIIPAAELQIRREVNSTAAPVSDDLLHTLFIKQAAEHPERVAIRSSLGTLTYEEVYRRACRVEDELLQRQVQSNQLIAVLMEKGWEQVVSVLGIHFAGAAYLPIDCDLPPERQRYLVEDAQAKIVLTQSAMQKSLSLPAGVEVLAVDLLPPARAAAITARKRQRAEDLAYVIYTSGSTGRPKGVMIDHRGAVNTVLDINQRFGVGPDDRVLALSRLSFDLSVYDIFGLLAAGGTVVIPSADLALDARHWAELISSEQITIWNTVPALMQLLVDQESSAIGPSLRLIMMSGDWIPVKLLGQIRSLLPPAVLVSLGGATEASVWSILYPIERIDESWKSVPYGKPMRNQSFHVLNPALALCPVWVPGQLYIGGMGVAKGYWRDPQKTAASFIRHPHTHERLYRTGDLGRYLPDGNIEFLGREDTQVKVQGYRVELGEIEAKLQEHEGVESCIVAVEDQNARAKRLIAYAVLKPGMHVDAEELRRYLRAKLPEYMVPVAFVFLERFSLTMNGKVDRKALPVPATATADMDSKPIAPRDALELQLTKLWEKHLGVHPVGLKDNFFDLGGSSLVAVRLFSELRRLTNRNMSLSLLFQAPTVEGLADVLRREGWSPRWSSLVPIQPGGSKPPFFCVHGAGGNVLLFRDLARYFAPDYPFYALQARGADGRANYPTSVEEMASYYLTEIQELQPQGPYYLGGFCMGGQVAYEMAQRICRSGQRVELLVMINTYNLNGIPLSRSVPESLAQFRQKAGFQWSNLARLSTRDKFAYMKKIAEIAYERQVQRLTVNVTNLFRTLVSPNGRGQAEVLLEQINDRAYLAYVPSAFPGKATIFKPQKNYAHLRDPQMGWGGLAREGLEVVELPVNPGGIFAEPYVRTLAEGLKIRIDRTLIGQDCDTDHP